MPFRLLGTVALLAAWSCNNSNSNDTLAPPSESVTIQVDSTQTFQTWRGWAGRAVTDLPASVRSAVIDAAVSDLGVTAIGIAAQFGPNSEHPNNTSWDSVGTMSFAQHWAVPLKQQVGSAFRLEVRSQGRLPSRQEVVRVLNGLQTVGLVPDTWIPLNEPDIGKGNLGIQEIADSIASACQAFSQLGVKTRISAPTFSTVRGSFAAAQTLRNDARLTGCIGEWSFHQYSGYSQQDLTNFATLRAATGIPTAMEEHHGANTRELIDDLVFANLSLWQRDGFGGNGCAGCYALYSTGGSNFFLAGNTGFFRQFYRSIRPDMVRWAATSSLSQVKTVAFGGGTQAAVVAQTVNGDTLKVRGLPAGFYQVYYTLGDAGWTSASARSPTATALPLVSISAGQELVAVIPAAGVITVQRS